MPRTSSASESESSQHPAPEGALAERPLELDKADLAAGRRIACPVLVLWAGQDELGRWFDVLETWRRWADDVRGRAVDAGHFLAEERPDEVAEELRAFFSG